MYFYIYILLFLNISISEDFREIFGQDYTNAVEFMEENEFIFDSISNNYHNDASLIKSTVFPELIRYSLIRDYLEIGSLELIYVSTGKVDFSVGTFQIKPSFIESLENYLRKFPDLKEKYAHKLNYGLEREIDIRKERIMRLKSIDFQITYLNLLYDIMEKWYPDIFKSEKEYQVRFFSTAYNRGFDEPSVEIRKYLNKKFFPYGPNANRTRYNYSNISWYFYKNDL